MVPDPEKDALSLPLTALVNGCFILQSGDAEDKPADTSSDFSLFTVDVGDDKVLVDATDAVDAAAFRSTLPLSF
jgi:hypothetical protein